MAALIPWAQVKARLFWLLENASSSIKMQQAKSGTSAATCKLMEPHCGSLALLWPNKMDNLNVLLNLLSAQSVPGKRIQE